MIGSLKRISFVIALASLPTAVQADTPLPVPAGYEMIAGAGGYFFLQTDSLRSNTVAGSRVTTAMILSFGKLDDGTDIYSLGEFRASCDSSELMRTKIAYISADQKLLGQDGKSLTASVTEGSPDAAMHKRLCSDWDQYD